MSVYRGLTWDHPRGRTALRQAAAENFGLIEWHVQPLEGFESAPIADLCANYDLVVMDHPHLGEALHHGCIRPLDAVFPSDFLSRLAKSCVGPSWRSYVMNGKPWAIPLDAATQVMAARTDLLNGPLPRTFEDVIVLAESGTPVSMCLAGPHALLSFLSLVSALDDDLDMADGGWPSTEVAMQAYQSMQVLYAHCLKETLDLNPIGLLDRMVSTDEIALVPHVYGYVNYSAPALGKRVDFHDAPRMTGRPGSIIGGTGIAISTRARLDEPLRNHLMWLLGDEAQCHHIPSNEGQPSLRSAWDDAAVNTASGNFYSQTRNTMDKATVRPRFDGYIAFQAEASTCLRDGLKSKRAAQEVVNVLARSFQTASKGISHD